MLVFLSPSLPGPEVASMKSLHNGPIVHLEPLMHTGSDHDYRQAAEFLHMKFGSTYVPCMACVPRDQITI